jgi:neurofibromin 1
MVAAAFPQSQLRAVGAFLFLRFLCPSLVAPEGFGLLQAPPSKDARRALGLISKILLNLANGVKFSKELHMLPFNSLIENNEQTLLKWFDECK